MKKLIFHGALLNLTLLVAFAVAPVALLVSGPAEPGQVALVIAPSAGAAAIVATLGGQEVGPMRAPFGVLAVLSAPEAARDLGAWAVLDGSVLARLCGIDVNEYQAGTEDA
ncbi:hypothetical protein KUL25_05620 [Rhodobacteraceae bacterium N5(2021)]|uniref:Uncharacterized protein n=1 Tax=Gymnodinialimonas phycosphaerae TaxID=2841589 RepID=A0A975TWY2_9RHOB|nr:hypothetical protein [Gymnodinialimonas phycosphaerae]MBY4892240.1 hypothetical protein [Gymnodinialimonas phycosphaerae]